MADDAAIDALAARVAELTSEVAHLRAENAALRGGIYHVPRPDPVPPTPGPAHESELVRAIRENDEDYHSHDGEDAGKDWGSMGSL